MSVGNALFNEAIKHLIQAEGGFVNHPNDPGGATKYGITLNTLRDYRNNPSLDAKDVELLNLDEAKEIYFERYYKPLGLNECTNRIACIILLDQAVNRGLSACIHDLHQIFGYKINPSFPRAVDVLNFYEEEFDKLPMLNISFAIDFLIRSQSEYLRIAKNNQKLAIFLNGWMNRTHRLFALIKTVTARP